MSDLYLVLDIGNGKEQTKALSAQIFLVEKSDHLRITTASTNAFSVSCKTTSCIREARLLIIEH